MPPEGSTSPRPPRRKRLRLWSAGHFLTITLVAAAGALFGLLITLNHTAPTGRWRLPLAILGALLGATILGGLCIIGIQRQIGTGQRLLPIELPTAQEGRCGEQPALPPSTGIRAHHQAMTPYLGALRCHVRELHGHDRAVSAVALSPDTRYVFSAGQDREIILWDRTTGFQLRALEPFSSGVHAVAFSPDGQLLAAAGMQRTGRDGTIHLGTVRVWDASSGLALRQIEFADTPTALAFLPDSRHLLVSAKDYLRFWELEGPSPLFLLPLQAGLVTSAEGKGVAISVDGQYALVGCGYTQDARLIDLDEGKEVRCLAGHGRLFQLFRRAAVTSVAFSPDGRGALTGSLDQTVRVWNLRTGTQVQCFAGHTGWWGWRGVVGVAWLADGERALSASEDRSVRLWEVSTGKELQRFDMPARITCLACSTDGRLAVAGCQDGVVRLLEVPEARIPQW